MGAIRGVRYSPSRALGPSGQVRPLCSYPSPKPPPPPHVFQVPPSSLPRPDSRCPSPAPPEPARERERTGGGGGRVAAARSPAGASQAGAQSGEGAGGLTRPPARVRGQLGLQLHPSAHPCSPRIQAGKTRGVGAPIYAVAIWGTSFHLGVLDFFRGCPIHKIPSWTLAIEEL